MKTFKIYQVSFLSDFFRDHRFYGSDNNDICTRRDVVNAIYDESYSFVGEMSAENLDELFHIGNTGGQPNEATSLSVGDVIVDEQGATFVIAPEGFDLIGFNDLSALLRIAPLAP